jgi:hypothetical protein
MPGEHGNPKNPNPNAMACFISGGGSQQLSSYAIFLFF